MIWLTWRQFRAPALVTGALLVALLAAVALTWNPLREAALSSGFTGCRADACAAAADTFLQSLSGTPAKAVYFGGLAVLIVMPALAGMFWGAPLVARELETGTYRMVFSQSVRRGRWLLVKLVSGGTALALGAGLAGLVLTRWAQPIDAANGDRILPLIFAGRGVVPIGWAALAFAVGLTAGLLLRRTLPAMAVALLVVAGLQIAAPLLVRPHLVEPVTTISPLDPDRRMGMSMNVETREMRLEVEPPADGAWVLSNVVVTAAGTSFAGPVDPATCGPEARDERRTCSAWLRAQNLSTKSVVHPASHFWALQWRESGLLVGLTLALSGFCLWWIRRRLA